MIKVKLSDGKVRELDSMVQTSFWSPDGKLISAEEFLQSMFGSLPDFFKNEDELRAIWSKPDTRKKLLQSLNEKGFTLSQLDDAKLPELLILKYKAIADAKRELGNIGSIRETFIGFQEYLYEEEEIKY